MSDTEQSIPPISCTLTTQALAKQTLEWTDLAPQALSRTELSNGVASTYPLDLATQIEDLAARERTCCGTWLKITHHRTDEALHLELTTANPEGIDLIKSMSGLT